jgi:hypothetical protein
VPPGGVTGAALMIGKVRGEKPEAQAYAYRYRSLSSRRNSDFFQALEAEIGRGSRIATLFHEVDETTLLLERPPVLSAP